MPGIPKNLVDEIPAGYEEDALARIEDRIRLPNFPPLRVGIFGERDLV